ncbi:hypothetical protein D3P07_15560 [Paenibacillus sp. 1011MAR3C5]|uniref:hypothetical protein n=1 Tax=Paenibacillus sp. 1011MAR3C5 TaxID=1675787 RepID=UPI000E6C7520|nr:hypothetical protein [Paenibacillus sp. 1011MAR3C5]RJE87719.1 hypothetical protein D3P07_15560 [Paenibacillus sp. 1011MAR3C5]
MYGKLALMLIVAGLLWGCSNEGSEEPYPDHKTEELIEKHIEDHTDESIRFIQDQTKATITEADGMDKLVTFEYALENKAAALEEVCIEIFIHDEKWVELVGLEHLRVNGELSEPVALEPSVGYRGSVSISIPITANLQDEDIEARLVESDAIEIQAVHAENKAILASDYVRSLNYVQESL